MVIAVRNAALVTGKPANGADSIRIAPLALFLVAILSAVVLFTSGSSAPAHRPDLVMATFSKEDAAAYAPAVAEFEKKFGVTVQLQVQVQRLPQHIHKSGIS
jgi:maltose-binding protein MalE